MLNKALWPAASLLLLASVAGCSAESNTVSTDGTKSLGATPVVALVAPTPAPIAPAPYTDITLIASTNIPASATDLSGLTGNASDGTPNNMLGSFGSAVAWTGQGNRYIVQNDRGPNNGEVEFKCRFHVLDIQIHPATAPGATVKLISTTLLKNEHAEVYTGNASHFNEADQAAGLRLDLEGVRVGPTRKTMISSDEYGPFIFEFDIASGQKIRALEVPPLFAIKHLSASADEEIQKNDSGRVTNKGFEGLAISPDGKKIYALIQTPLLQDGGKESAEEKNARDETTGKKAKGSKGIRPCRMLEIDYATGKALRQLVVMLDKSKGNFNELLAINDHEFLAIERDGKPGSESKEKRIVKLDITGATDVSGIPALSNKALPEGVVPVKSETFIDLLDPRWGLINLPMPEKIEGIAFGPDLTDGSHTLVVTIDNDLLPAVPNYIWVFAIPKDKLPGFVPQQFQP